jgi:hypothetical protein
MVLITYLAFASTTTEVKITRLTITKIQVCVRLDSSFEMKIQPPGNK